MNRPPRIEPITGIVEFDLHGLSALTAGDIAETWVREAWEHGCSAVRLIHGSRFTAYEAAAGQGTIKSLLWQKLKDGDFRRYAVPPGSGDHRREGASLLVRLQPNPDPDPHGPWTRPPLPEYE